MSDWQALGLLLVWFIIGVASFIFWWTSEDDLHLNDLPIGIMVGLLLGPIAFLAGFLIHGKSKSRIIFKGRG